MARGLIVVYGSAMSRSAQAWLGPLAALVVLLWGGSTEGAYVAPRRSLKQLAHAIDVSRPGMADGKRQALARLVIDVAKAHNFDPLSGWAIIDHESRWDPKAISADGQDIGLAQIRYTVQRPCVEDRDSEACEAVKERLLDPAVNIRTMAGAISAWRKLCTEKMGKAPDMRDWLAGYGGYSRPSEDIYCGHKRVRRGKGWVWKRLPTPKGVQEILDGRHRMIRRLRKDGVK